MGPLNTLALVRGACRACSVCILQYDSSFFSVVIHGLY